MFTLTSDSAIDVFRARADELGIRIIPLTYTVDGVTIEDFASGEDEYKKFYDDLKNGSMPVTSQINPFAHEEFWEKVYAEDKQDIVHITLSSGLSQTYTSACKAAESFMEKHPGVHVYVVDSLGATQAEAPVYEKAIELRDSGVSAADAAEALAVYPHRIQVYIIVDDLFHLKRGGRISAASAVMGTMIGIKPIIVFNEEGKLCVYKKPVGAQNRARSHRGVLHRPGEQKNMDRPCGRARQGGGSESRYRKAVRFEGADRLDRPGHRSAYQPRHRRHTFRSQQQTEYQGVKLQARGRHAQIHVKSIKKQTDKVDFGTVRNRLCFSERNICVFIFPAHKKRIMRRGTP